MPDQDSFQKLFKPPVQENLNLTRGEKPQEPIPVFLSPLGFNEGVHVSATAKEAHRTMEANGAEPEDCDEAFGRAHAMLTVFYAVKVKNDKGELVRLFRDQREILTVPLTEIIRLADAYFKEYGITDEDLGNCLRARTTTTSKT